MERGTPDQPHNPWADPAVEARQPFLKLPWPVAVLVVLFIGLYALETVTGGADPAATRFGFAPAALSHGGGATLVTALFVHGSWGHVLANSAFALAFCAPVARRFGRGALGALLFFIFFLVCGVIGNLGFALVHPNGGQVVVGASGGIAGFIGGTSRLLWKGPGIAPLNSPTVLAMAVSIIGLNLAVGLLHVDLGFGTDGASVAWEAHVAGYLAGLFLIGLFDLAIPKRKLQRGKD
jgi:membrane associated rhomboid family serine protease